MGEEKPHQEGAILNLFFFIGSIVGAFIVLQMLFAGDFAHHQILSNIFPETNAERFDLLRQFGLKFGIFLLGLVLSIITCRVFLGRPAPALQRDTKLITTLNRILNNSIEQFIIFTCIYFYVLFDEKNFLNEKKLIHLLPLGFLIARFIFTVMYTLSVFIGIATFRSLGFLMNIAIVLIMIESVYSPKQYIYEAILQYKLF